MAALTLEVIQDHLALLAVAKPSLEDCPWVKRKASDVLEYSGGDKNVQSQAEDQERRKQLIDIDASSSLLVALQVMTKCGENIADRKFSSELVDAICFLLLTLRNLARDPDEGVRLVQSSTVTRDIARVLTVFDTCAAICRNGCAVLTNLAVPPINRHQVFDCCCGAVINCMRKNSGDVKVAQNGCGCLMNLANDVTLLRDMGGIASGVLVEVAMIHSKDTEVVQNAESAFAALLVDRENAISFMANDSTTIIELILNTMRLHSRNAVVGEQGLRCIFSLAQHQENKAVMVRCGCLQAIHSTIVASPFPIVAEWGCKAMRAMSHNNQTMKAALYQAGAAGWTLDLIRSHGTVPSVVKAGLSVIWSLANHPTNKNALVSHDSADVVIINAMRLNPESVTVALTGSAALASLANEPQTKKKMLKNGAVTAVLHAMNTHPLNVFVCEHGCGCLWSLAMDREVQKSIMRDSLAAKAIIDAMTQHSGKRTVIVKALGAAENLAYGQEPSKLLVSCGIVPIVSSMIKLHLTDDLDIVIRCCNVLANIAHFTDDVSIFQKHGVAEIAVDIQRMHPTDDSCSRAAERLLTSMEGRTLMPT